MTVDAQADLAALASAYGKAWNSGDLEAVMSFHADEATFCLQGGGERHHGKEAVREAFAQTFRQWPDLKFASRRLLVGDGFFAHEMTLSGRIGEQMISVPVVDVITLRDGLIVDKDTYLDSGSVSARLGH